jgi:nucleotide-binding universal stress UspA family protein
MKVVVWLAEGTWEACVDAARELTRDNDELTLLHVLDPGMSEALRDAQLGLLGRGDPAAGAAAAVEEAAAAAEEALLATAEQRLGRPSARQSRRGRPEDEVVSACEGAALLIMARDGDHTRLGPRSLAPPSRFVLDHAPCRVLLVWPDEPPGVATIPHRAGHPGHGPGDGPGRHGPPGPHHEPGPHGEHGPHHEPGPARPAP